MAERDRVLELVRRMATEADSDVRQVWVCLQVGCECERQCTLADARRLERNAEIYRADLQAIEAGVRS